MSALPSADSTSQGVGAGRSAKRGTSAATTGPRGARSAPPNPERLCSLLFVEGLTASRARGDGGQRRGGLEGVGGAAARTAAGWATGADQVAAAPALPTVGQLA